MKRQIFTILIALALALTGVLYAQSAGPAPDAQDQPSLQSHQSQQHQPTTEANHAGQPQDTASGTPASGYTGDSLPQTGSGAPILGVIGFLTLFAGIVVRALRW